MNYYYELLLQSKRINKFIQTLPILKEIYDEKYFSKVKQQIIKMKPRELSGPINSMFILMTDDEAKGFIKLKLLEKYLSLIFKHSSTKKSDKKYIKEELLGDQGLNTLFEVNIIGNVLSQLPSKKVKLYVKTHGKKNIDLEVVLIDRPIYVEISVLGESKGDKNIRDTMTRNKINFWSGSRDLNIDSIRFASKIKFKTEQFVKGKPNVLILSKFDIFPDKFSVESVMKQNCFLNVGLILQFNRKDLQIVYEDNLDPNCSLSKIEISRLVKLFKEKAYKPLYY